MSSAACILAAKRSPVVPRAGAFARLEPHDIAAPVIAALLTDAGMDGADVNEVIVGNALSGGGNLARVVALAAGLPDHIGAITIDTQCCAGLDAIMLAKALIKSGERRVVIAGGVESYSRAPHRLRRAKAPGEAAQEYARPAFTPWPDRDPDMLEAAAQLAQVSSVSRAVQEDYAIRSHAKALAPHDWSSEIVPLAGLARDVFARPLSAALCARLPVLAGDEAHGVTAATIAVEADAAALVLVVAEELAERFAPRPLARIVAGARVNGDPAMPPLAPIKAARHALMLAGLDAERCTHVEIMEAFAVQAMACADAFGFDPARINRQGGALSRGHPIGASGAILAVRLWHELQASKAGASGLAMIAAAGGLGSAMILERV